MLIIRYSEIGLKKGNRKYFENSLGDNIAYCMKNKSIEGKVKMRYGRILVETDNNGSFLKTIFGIASYSSAERFDDFDAAKIHCLKLFEKRAPKTFALDCQRLDKAFPINSVDVEKQIAEFIIQKHESAKVKLSNPDFEIGVEIIEKRIYVFTERVQCFGGLPLGTQGKVLGLIENEKSLLASLLLMRRGCTVIPCSFKVQDVSLLEKYSCQKITTKLINSIEELKMIAEKENAKAVVSAQKRELDGMIILLPLSGFTEKEMEEKLNAFRNA